MRQMCIAVGGILMFGTLSAQAQSSSAPAAPPMAQSAAEAPPASSPDGSSTPGVSLPVPVMAGPLSLSPSPPKIDTNGFGTWYVDGAFSALGLVQNNPGAGDQAAIADVSNAQIFVQKVDGLVRFYIQFGAYALPALGQTYAHETNAGSTWKNFFDPVPQAFLKLALSDAFSVQAGKLPTLIGGEYTFTFENVNIARGLLWTQEPAVSRGIQANYIAGPVGLSLSLNDGFYSGRYTWLSGSASWTINPANVLVFAAGADLDATRRNDLATPIDQNNSSIYNLIYTYTKGPLMVSPYLQYSAVTADKRIGIRDPASLYGGAMLVSYALTPSLNFGARVEYETSSAAADTRAATNLLYGPGSNATSFTVTPTYTHGHWFMRADLSALAIGHETRGDGLGHDGASQSQFRSLVETGYIF